MKQFFQLIKVQYLEFLREPGVIFWALLFPVIMAWGLGIAFTGKEKQERSIAWIKNGAPGKIMTELINDSTEKAEYVKTLGNEKTGQVLYHFIPTNKKEAELMIKRGKASIIISEENESVNYFFDPKNPEAQLSYLQISGALQNKCDSDDMAQISPLDQKGMRYVDFLVPGLLAMNIMFGCLWGVSYSLIDKRSKKLLRRMVATPMNKVAFLCSYLFTRLTLSIMELVILLFFSWLYFDMTVQGSIPALIVVLFAGNIVFFGLAVLLSSRTGNTQIANGLINAVSMPMMICSGIFFSYHNFPGWLTPIIEKLPLTIIADSMRSIFIEGAGFSESLPAIFVLLGFGLLFFLVGKKVYKWY